MVMIVVVVGIGIAARTIHLHHCGLGHAAGGSGELPEAGVVE